MERRKAKLLLFFQAVCQKQLSLVILLTVILSLQSRSAIDSTATLSLNDIEELIRKGDLDRGYESLLRLKNQFLLENDSLNYAVALIKMGKIQVLLGEFNNAQGLYFNAIQWLPEKESQAERADVYNGIANNYYRQQRYDSSTYYFSLAEELLLKIDDQSRLKISRLNKGSLMLGHGDYKGAIANYTNILDQLDSNLYVAATLNLGVAYLNLDQRDSADYFLNKALSGSLQSENTEYQIYALRNLGYLSYNFDDYKAACDYYEEYRNIKDSLYSASTAVSITQLEQDYALAKEQLALKEAELETLTWQRWVIAIAALFVIGLLTVWGIYKRRKAIQKVKTQAILQTRELENKRITDLLWKEIGDSTKGGKLSLPGQELPEHTIPGAIAAVRFLSNQQFNPYLQLGLTKAVDNLIDVLSKGKEISIKRELENITIDRQDRLIYYRIIENILVEVFSRLNTSDVKIELNVHKSDLHFEVEADEVMDKNQLRFQSAEARIHQLDGKLKFDIAADLSKVKVVIPLQKA